MITQRCQKKAAAFKSLTTKNIVILLIYVDIVQIIENYASLRYCCVCNILSLEVIRGSRSLQDLSRNVSLLRH